MRKRITYEDIKNRMKEKGLEIIEESYTDFNHEWYVIDENGYKLRCVKSTYYSDAIPHFVDKKNKYVIDNIKMYLKSIDYGCELISEEYENKDMPLEFRCLSCGKKFSRAWCDVEQGEGKKYCKECNIKLRRENTRVTLQEAKEMIKDMHITIDEESYKCISESCLGYTDDGYKVLLNADTFRKNRIPSIFSNTNPYTIDNIKRYIEINNLDVKLLSDKYVSISSPLEFRCSKCNEKFETTFSKIKEGKINCMKCRIENGEFARTDIEEIRKKLDELDCDLISTEYIGETAPIEFICRKHRELGIQTTNKRNIRKGNACHECGRINSLHSREVPDEEMKEMTEKKGFIFVGTTYEYGRKSVLYKCKKHLDKGVFVKAYADMRKSKGGCPYCLGYGRTHEDFVEEIKKISPNIRILSEYNQTDDYIDCECLECGHKWSTKASLLLSGAGCKKCADKRNGIASRKSQEQFEEQIKEIHPNISILSNYITAKDKVLCKCNKCNHEWWATPDSLLSKGRSDCPACSSYYNEGKMVQLLEKWDYRVETQKYFEDCKDISYLKFDAFLTDFNTCVEYDGEQHYNPIPWGGISEDEANQTLLDVQRRDKIKDEYCKNNGIKLIRIPYWKSENMEEYLFDELVKNGIIEEITAAS